MKRSNKKAYEKAVEEYLTEDMSLEEKHAEEMRMLKMMETVEKASINSVKDLIKQCRKRRSKS